MARVFWFTICAGEGGRHGRAELYRVIYETASWLLSRAGCPAGGHAKEQDCPDVLKRCKKWFDGLLDLDPDKLVFINER